MRHWKRLSAQAAISTSRSSRLTSRATGACSSVTRSESPSSSWTAWSCSSTGFTRTCCAACWPRGWRASIGHRRKRGRALDRSATTQELMTFREEILAPEHELDSKPLTERLSLGVAARLSRYLQVLTQAKKMGKETISSQELSDYTHINSTQIRRDLSGFGKFGKRGVGYNVESLVSQIRKILRTAGQHNIALLGAGHLGKAIASSDIFADHGFRVVAIFDVDPDKVGTTIGNQVVRHT